MNLNGVFTALVTPFSKNGSVDEKALRDLVDFQINEGISGLVPMGTTGESPTLNHDEHIHVIEIVIDQTNGRVPVIAGTGSNATGEAINMTRYAAEIGAKASLQVAPYYNKPTQEGFYRHFAEISKTSDIPLIVYNIPGRSGKNIENSTMLRLAKLQNVIAVKEASGDIVQVMDLIRQKPETLSILSGDDNLGFPIISLGGCGIISVASNIIPKEMERMVKMLLDGKNEDARALHYRLLPLFKNLFIETNPIPIKLALSLQGKIEEQYRLPMCPMAAEHRGILTETLKSLNLI